MTKVVAVTGAAGGIGTAVCEVFERDGWTVLAVDIAAPSVGRWLEIDVADSDTLVAALGRLPRVDALVNNAAAQLDESLAETSVEQWDSLMATNLRSCFVATRAVLEQLSSARGSVVNVASVHAHASSSRSAAYASAKGGLLALTRAAAVELGPLGVRVNAVSPGAVDTPALRRGSTERGDAFVSRIADRTPLRRVGRPRDVAEAVRFLADPDRAAFVTGQSLIIDGGALAQLSTE